MKVLHVLYSGLGGHGNVFFSMVSADTKHEFNFEALFYGIEEVRHEFREDCIKQHIPWYFAKKRSKFDLAYYVQILKFIKKSNPDVIFLHGSAYILPARIAALLSIKRTKIIVRETQANHLKTKAQWVSLTGSMFFANEIVCLTAQFRDQVKKKLGMLYRGKKITIIPNGINLDVYKPGHLQLATHRNPARKIVIGMQSRLVPIKDHVTLLKAIAAIKKEQGVQCNIQLRIAGDGDYRNELERFTNELGLESEVEFTGMIPETELVDFLQSLDIYVHASLGETMSTAIMQAMACKLPIIASDVNGINNMVSNGLTGILVPAQNEVALVEALGALIADEELASALAQHAYEYAHANFSNQKMLELYKNLF